MMRYTTARVVSTLFSKWQLTIPAQAATSGAAKGADAPARRGTKVKLDHYGFYLKS
jgi:hypothetical protein